MQTGIIKDVTEVKPKKAGGNIYYRVAMQDGAEMTTFDAKIKEAVPGDSLEFEPLINGKFVNLKDGWRLIKRSSTTSEASTSPSTPAGQNDGPAERESNERQCCLKASVEMFQPGETLQVVINRADQMYAYLRSGTAAFESYVWIMEKMLELSISQASMLDYINKTFHVPAEAGGISKILNQLSAENRAEIVKLINTKESRAKEAGVRSSKLEA